MSKFKSGDRVVRKIHNFCDVIVGLEYTVTSVCEDGITLSEVLDPYQSFDSTCFELADSKPTQSPPLGIIPYNLFLESLETDLKETEKVLRDRRKADLQEAIKRYGEDGKDIPYEWVKELMGEV